MRVVWIGIGVMVIMYGIANIALATPSAPVPEIDGGTIAAGLSALAAGVFVLRARR